MRRQSASIAGSRPSGTSSRSGPSAGRCPGPWDPIAGDYECRDGWIRLHTNAPCHRAAAERVLGVQPDKAAMARVVRQHDGGAPNRQRCRGRSGTDAVSDRMAAHPQRIAVAAEPLIAFTRHDTPALPCCPACRAGRCTASACST
ncbi:MAG: hypothetical protein R3E68_03925 [Burkholderiaceae bacterium]